MYNPYTTSTLSLKSTVSPSFSFNDRPSYSRHSSYNARPPYSNSSSCCCNCNCCSSVPVNCVTSCGLVPISPSLTYGFRQSTLIQWPPSRRRFVVSSVDRCGFDDSRRTRIPYGRLCCIRDASVDRRKEESKNLKAKGIGLRGYRKRVFEERLVFRRIGSACEDAEAIISLLTEEVDHELLYRNGKANKNAANGKSNYRKGDELECEEAQNRKESYRMTHREEDLDKGVYSRLRKQVSSDSSYYSCSDSGDYESDSEAVEVRKKHTKKHTEDSFGESASRKTYNINQSRRSEACVSSEEASRMKKEKSISDMNSSEALRSGYSRNDKRVSGTSDSKSDYDPVQEKPIGYSKKVMVREENVVSSCICATCGHEQRPKISQIQENNINLVSNIDTQAESWHKRTEERSSLLQMSVNEVNQQQHHVASSQMNSQDYTGSADAAQSYEVNTNLFRRRDKHSEAQNTDTRLTSTANQQSNTRINRQENSLTSLQTSREDVNEKIRQENLVSTSRTNFMRKNQNHSGTAEAGVSSVQNSFMTQKEEEAVKVNISSQLAHGGQYQRVTENQYKNASQDVSVGSQAHIHETTISSTQSASNKKFHHKQSYLTEKVTSAEQRTETHGASTSQIRIEEIDDQDYEKNLPRLAPRTQSIERDSVYAESACTLIKGDSSQSSEGDTGIYIYPQVTGIISSSGQDSSQHVDLLSSAERQNRSSLEVIGEFVDKARHEASTSATQMRLVDEESTQSVGGNLELRKQYSRRSSGSVRDAVSGRTGRNLWNVIADIARFRWGPRAETNTGVKSSSSDSVKSEAWFSGHDPDEVKGSDMNKSTSSRVQDSSPTDAPLLIRTPTQTSTDRFTLLSTGDDARPTVHNPPSSSSGGVSGENNIEEEEEEEKETSRATTSVDWSQPVSGLLRRSHRRSYAAFEGGNEADGNIRTDQIKDSTQVSGSGDNAVELERRKLLRNKQVVRERFEEWEEAYKMESEQRKMDETFMREALEEAKKAADMWEVPVGAVLVHDGKIIARGCNLVEDLRDSTAHAEMICIREGSNVLKAWRLSDTTLYVTLEPCAMCAGAILQARIGTLVYGAPNKLLGADGSWIRLFPSSSGDGGGSSDGPVHPFHPNMRIRRGILETECSDAMQQFFRLRRKKDKKTEQQQQHESSNKKLLIHPSKLLNKMHHVFHFLFCL